MSKASAHKVEDMRLSVRGFCMLQVKYPLTPKYRTLLRYGPEPAGKWKTVSPLKDGFGEPIIGTRGLSYQSNISIVVSLMGHAKAQGWAADEAYEEFIETKNIGTLWLRRGAYQEFYIGSREWFFSEWEQINSNRPRLGVPPIKTTLELLRRATANGEVFNGTELYKIGLQPLRGNSDRLIEQLIEAGGLADARKAKNRNRQIYRPVSDRKFNEICRQILLNLVAKIKFIKAKVKAKLTYISNTGGILGAQHNIKSKVKNNSPPTLDLAFQQQLLEMIR